jgi:type VI protein secretion system component VasK
MRILVRTLLVLVLLAMMFGTAMLAVKFCAPTLHGANYWLATGGAFLLIAAFATWKFLQARRQSKQP